MQFELRDGEIMALLGENGAGKSTLVKLLSGLIQPDAGSIEIHGRQVDLRSSADAQAAGIAVVQQEYSSVPSLSVAENLALGDTRSGWWWNRRNLLRGVREVLDQVGLSHLDPWTRVEQLTVAESQLVELARMLRRDARILILDEPTAALSDRETQRVLAVLKSLARSGRSVVFVTHRLNEVFAIADRVTVFKNGESSPPTDVSSLTERKVVAMMLGRELSTMFPDRPSLDGQPVRLNAKDLVIPGLRQPISLSVRRGEILGLTGQLGSGASAVVRALAGLETIASGTVEIDGVQAHRLGSRTGGIALGVAYCSDDRKLDGMFQGISVQKNLSSAWLPRVSTGGWLRPFRERIISREIAGEFAFDPRRLSAAVDTLSGGNQQKIVLGKWLGTQPRILLMEEPTRGVDIGARAEIYSKLRALTASGTTIIVVSSDSTEILGMCDTIAAFYHGHVNGYRAHSEWDTSSLLQASMHAQEVRT